MTKLHSEQDAIKQALEAGYESNPGNGIPSEVSFDAEEESKVHIFYRTKSGENGGYRSFTIEQILLDPAFWQALSKARGWDFIVELNNADRVGNWMANGREGGEWLEYMGQEWEYHALRYFEARLSNGEMEAYWESLP